TSSREVLPDGIDGLTVVEGTVADRTLVDKVFAEFEPTHVVHSAAAYKDPDDWDEDAASNVTGTINLVEASKKHDVRRFINFQTALCYGIPDEVPIPVTHACRPVTSYGISKVAGEQYVALSDLPYVSLRLASVIGPRLSIGAIPTFYTRLKDGKPCFCTTAVRDFLDIDDFFALMDAVMAESAATGVYNAGPGVGHSIKDVFDAVVAYLGIELEDSVEVRPVGDDDIPEVVLDPSVTEKNFGWRAQVSFEASVEKMLRWYDAHGVSAIYSHLKPPAPAD
ncbi:MAG: NAD-dependent epimerase/dehydratase family protein, partial [Pseudomonadota bacterium]